MGRGALWLCSLISTASPGAGAQPAQPAGSPSFQRKPLLPAGAPEGSLQEGG